MYTYSTHIHTHENPEYRNKHFLTTKKVISFHNCWRCIGFWKIRLTWQLVILSLVKCPKITLGRRTTAKEGGHIQSYHKPFIPGPQMCVWHPSFLHCTESPAIKCLTTKFNVTESLSPIWFSCFDHFQWKRDGFQPFHPSRSMVPWSSSSAIFPQSLTSLKPKRISVKQQNRLCWSSSLKFYL